MNLEARIQPFTLPFTLFTLQYVLQGEVCSAEMACIRPHHQTETMKLVSIKDASDFNHIACSIQLLDRSSCDCLKYTGHCAWTYSADKQRTQEGMRGN